MAIRAERPTGYVDSGNTWTNEPLAYDGNMTTYAIEYLYGIGWGNFIEFTYDEPVPAASLVIHGLGWAQVNQIEIDIYYDDAWHTLYHGAYGMGDVIWYFAEQNVTAYRARFYNSQTGNRYQKIEETFLYRTLYAPTVTTQEPTDIITVSALGHGTITATGGNNATTRGFCYIEGTEGDPTTANSKVYDTGNFGVGAYTKSITGLSPGTSYRVRAYAINETGTGYGDTIQFETLGEVSVTTEAASSIGVDHAKGNGTTNGDNITERGFEVNLEFSGTLRECIDHSIAGFLGDVTFSEGVWSGTLVKTITETGAFDEGAFTGDLGRFPVAVFSDKLFPAETYTYRAYATINGEKYYGEYVEFTTSSYPVGEGPDDIVSPEVPIIEPIPPIPPIIPEFEWPEIVEPEFEWPEFDIPPFEFDPSVVFGKTFGAFLRGMDTKKDWETLREKCIIYQENMNEFVLTINHNSLVLKNLVIDVITYINGDVYPSDLGLVESSQQLTPLYLEEISPSGFKDIINDFRLKDVCNVHTLNLNFKKILSSLNSLYESDYVSEPILYDTIEYMDIQPTAKRMILQLEDMRKKYEEVRRLTIRNMKRIFTYT